MGPEESKTIAAIESYSDSAISAVSAIDKHSGVEFGFVTKCMIVSMTIMFLLSVSSVKAQFGTSENIDSIVSTIKIVRSEQHCDTSVFFVKKKQPSSAISCESILYCSNPDIILIEIDEIYIGCSHTRYTRHGIPNSVP